MTRSWLIYGLRKVINRNNSHHTRLRWGLWTPISKFSARALSSVGSKSESRPHESTQIDPLVAVQGLKRLLVKRRVMFIRKALEEYAKNSSRISYDDFEDICKLYGLTTDEAEEVADMLEDSLCLVQYKSLNGGPNETLFLRPKVLIDEILRKVDPDLKLLKAEKRLLEQREEEFKVLDAKHTAILKNANWYARVHVLGLTGLLSGQYVLFSYLVYSDGDFALGWDIMEPVTYLYGIFFGNLAILYIAVFGVDFTVPSYIRRIAERRRLQLCESENFDLERYENLKKEIAELRSQLEPPEAFVLSPPIDVPYKL
ncbi:hypothetical protein AAMO2058_000206600 [Amorphochlora amoebiformis]